MNCDILREDIEKLKALRDQLGEKANNATETGTGKIDVMSIQKEAEQASDQILEKYLDDFFDKNPNLLQISFNKSIKGFEDRNGNRATVLTIAPIPNGNMLIGGREGTLYEYQKQEDGSYELSGLSIDIGGQNISAIAPLPNGDMLIGGDEGSLCEYQNQGDGFYQLSKIGKKDSVIDSVSAIAPLPNGDMLIGVVDILYKYQKQSNGLYHLSDGVEIARDKQGHRIIINAIAPLPNGNMLIGGKDSTDNAGALCEYQSDGSYRLERQGYRGMPINAIAPLPNGNMLIGGTDTLCEYQQQSDGSYRVRGLAEGLAAILPEAPNNAAGITHFLSTVRPQMFRVNAIAPLPNGNMLIGGSFGVSGFLCEYQKQPDGSYELSDHLLEGPHSPVHSISSLPSGDILVGGEIGDLFELNGPTKSLATLKKSLDKIIDQENS